MSKVIAYLCLIVAMFAAAAQAKADGYRDAIDLIRLLKKEGRPENSQIDVSAATATGKDSASIEYRVIKEPPMPIYSLRIRWHMSEIEPDSEFNCLLDMSTTYYGSHAGGMWRRMAIVPSETCKAAVTQMSIVFPEVFPMVFDDIVSKSLADLRRPSL